MKVPTYLDNLELIRIKRKELLISKFKKMIYFLSQVQKSLMIYSDNMDHLLLIHMEKIKECNIEPQKFKIFLHATNQSCLKENINWTQIERKFLFQ